MNELDKRVVTVNVMPDDAEDKEEKIVAVSEWNERFSDAKFALMFALVVLFYWISIIYFMVKDIEKTRECTTYELTPRAGESYVYLRLYDEKNDKYYDQYGYSFKISYDESDVRFGKVTVYYHEKTNSIHNPQSISTWVALYAMGVLMVVILGFWIKATMFKEKHAVTKEEHSNIDGGDKDCSNKKCVEETGGDKDEKYIEKQEGERKNYGINWSDYTT